MDTEHLRLAEDWAPVFHALGDPTRLKLLLAMHYFGAGAASVTQLSQAASVRPATASAALNKLADAGVVRAAREGRHVRYALVDERVHRLLHHVGATHAPG